MGAPGSLGISSTAAEASPQSPPLRRNAARAAILQAGRRVAARDGVSEFSLSAVAAEAGFGPSTVFGHFRNKDELLVAIVAEDLAGVAAQMHESSTRPDCDRIQDETDWSKIDLIQGFESGRPTEDIVTEVLDEPNAAPVEAAAGDVAPGFAGPAKNAPLERVPVDAWLERRLRTFERGLADLEQRMKETEASTSWAVSISKDNAKVVAERLDVFDARQTEAFQNLTRRMEETEMRQRGTTAEMRAAMNDTATRIEILETARRFVQPRPELAESGDGQAQNDAAHEETDLRSDESYLSAAQRAASAAVLLADMDSKTEERESPSAWHSFVRTRVQIRRRHYVIAACLAALAFVLGGFFAFYIGVAHGHEMAARTSATAVFAPPRVLANIAPNQAVATKPVSVQVAPSDRLHMLAEQGNARAQLLVGLKYLHGEGTTTDQPLAAQWIRRAAEQQEPMAEYWLAAMYEHGNGVAADSSEAVRWYEAAAAQGNRKAMHALGVAYADGRGTSKDYSQAARWFSRAASLGLVNSQFNLAVLYERGLGVPQSLLDAYKWYAIAAAQGDQESTARVDVLKTQLSADDLDAAQRAAADFHADETNPAANTNPVYAELTGNPPTH